MRGSFQFHESRLADSLLAAAEHCGCIPEHNAQGVQERKEEGRTRTRRGHAGRRAQRLRVGATAMMRQEQAAAEEHHATKKVLGTPAQPVDYYCVLDFEATCQEGSRINPQEIIEFPTVLIEASTMRVVDEFQSYVRPVHNPKLTAFCTDLTGIQQQWVERAPVFAEALKQHTEWLQRHGLAVEGAKGHSFLFVTCGDWDLKTMLPAQLRMERDRRVPAHFRQWINIKRIYSQRMPGGGRQAGGMAGMLRGLGLTLEGRHHSGIDDCRNIAKIVVGLAARGAVLNSTASGGSGGGDGRPARGGAPKRSIEHSGTRECQRGRGGGRAHAGGRAHGGGRGRQRVQGGW